MNTNSEVIHNLRLHIERIYDVAKKNFPSEAWALANDSLCPLEDPTLPGLAVRYIPSEVYSFFKSSSVNKVVIGLYTVIFKYGRELVSEDMMLNDGQDLDEFI